MKNDLSNTEIAHVTELPESVRIPLHSLQADLEYLIGRVIADSSCGPMIVKSMRDRLDKIEAHCIGVAQTMPRHTALELLARADKYLNTGSNEYASEILRDMTEFVRKSIIRKELRNADLPKHPMTPHSPDDPSLSSTHRGEK